MDKNYGGVVWTNHAIERMSQRGISQGDAWATWRNPQQSRKATIPGAWVYYRTYGREKIEVVAKKNERGEWLILSVWSRSDLASDKTESFLSFILKRLFRKK